MRMELGLSQHQAIKQIQTLSPQMYMSMEILCMNSLDLEERVETELENNETLELVEPGADEKGEASESGAAAETAKDTSTQEDAGLAEAGADDNFDQRFEQWEQYSREEFSSGRSTASYRGEKDEKLEAISNTEGRPTSLQEHLEGLVHLIDDDEIQAIAREYRRQRGLDEGELLQGALRLESSDASSGDAATDARPGSSAPARVRELPAEPGRLDHLERLDQRADATASPASERLGRIGELAGAGDQTMPSGPSAASNRINGSLAAQPNTQSPADRDPAGNFAGNGVAGSRLADALSPASLERVRQLCESVIYNIDERGYLMFGLEEIQKSLDEPAPIELLEIALKIVQSLEPAGIGGRGLEECLLLQLERDPQEYPIEERIIAEHLQDLGHNRLPKIARALGLTIDEVKDAMQIIASLNPLPGKIFGGEMPRYVKPDVIVDEIDGKYEVRVESEYLPRLQVSPHYRNLYQESRKNPEVKKYLKKKMDGAEWLMAAIRQRQSTLQKIAQEIVTIQSGFLDHGISQLKPLKMSDVAEILGVHVSTVSRALSGKYMQTPRGIFEMKFFFTGGATKADGEVEARGSVIQRIKDLVAKEDKKKPLSDINIVRKLAESGIKISRRTVTKYREAEAIPSSRERREY